MDTFQIKSVADRRVARYLLRQRGLTGDAVGRLTYAELADALEVRGVTRAQWEEVWERIIGISKGRGDGTGGHELEPDATPALPVPAPATGPVGSVDGAIQAMLAAMVATLPKPEAALRPEVLEAEVEKQVTAAFDARVPRVIHVEYKGTVREVSGVKHYLFDDVLAALAARQHVWLPGPAGSGKSTLARQCGEALGYSEPEPNESENTPKRIHMTGAIETPFQLLGYVSPNGDARTLFTPFRKAWQYGGLFIFDDVDRSNSKALAAFNEPLANGHCAFPDGVIKMHADCLIVATANTFGLGGSADYVGAARLDKATLDRFVYIEVPYDEKAERLIAGPDGTEWCLFVQKVRGACRRLGLKHLVTPRATYKGLALMRAGMSRDKVEAATVYAGLDPETITRIRGAF